MKAGQFSERSDFHEEQPGRDRRIEDPDFGCEERPEGRPAACQVFLKELPENGDGSRCKDKVFAMLMEERLLEERGLAEGMTVVLDEDGTLVRWEN